MSMWVHGDVMRVIFHRKEHFIGVVLETNVPYWGPLKLCIWLSYIKCNNNIWHMAVTQDVQAQTV